MWIDPIGNPDPNRGKSAAQPGALPHQDEIVSPALELLGVLGHLFEEEGGGGRRVVVGG